MVVGMPGVKFINSSSTDGQLPNCFLLHGVLAVS